MQKQFKQIGAVSQGILIALVVAITAIIITVLLVFSQEKSADHEQDEHGYEAAEKGESDGHDDQEHAEDEHAELALTPTQMIEHGVKLDQVKFGEVAQTQQYPAKLIANTDQQAHVSPMFTGRVETVSANLGQNVKKGQTLATIISPDLVGQQSELQFAQSNLQLAQQEYQREQKLWSQGVSAQQDYQRAYHSYKQAQIAVQVARSRINALGAASSSNGRYSITAPMSGIISQKDIMVGENVQIADQLFVIDQLGQLWLEFVLPTQPNLQLAPNQQIDFISLQSNKRFKARIQTLSSEADMQTGRLQIRALVLANAEELRPNLMVNVEIASAQSQAALRVQKQAIQQIDGKTTIFIATQHGEKFEFQPQIVELGNYSSDQQWVEIKKGLTQGQSYVSQGSFLLKSELEKGEAAHEH